jgi:hypothetical protein
MKKLILFIILTLFAVQCYAITWTKDWSSTDDGKVLSGSDIADFQRDVSDQVFNPSSNTSFSSSLTGTGTSLFSGLNTFTSAVTVSSHVHVSTVPAGTYKTIKTGYFTRDISLADGNISYTGVGFKPTSVIFFTAISGSEAASWGIDNITSKGVVVADGYDNPDCYTAATTGSTYLVTHTDPRYSYGHVESFDSDGFTIHWVAFTGPVGTATINYMAFKK